MNELIRKCIFSVLLSAFSLGLLAGCYSAHTSFESADADMILGHSPRYTVLFKPLDLSVADSATYSARGLPTHRLSNVRVQYTRTLKEQLGSDSDARFVITITEADTGVLVGEFSTGEVIENPEWHQQLLLLPPLDWENSEKGLVWDRSDYTFEYTLPPTSTPSPYVDGAWSDGAGAYVVSLPGRPDLEAGTAYTFSLKLESTEEHRFEEGTRAYLMYLSKFRW